LWQLRQHPATPHRMRSTSPLIVWLLIAANVLADVIALAWSNSSSDYNEVAYFALLSAQLSAVCIWSGLRPAPNTWTRLAPISAILVVSFAFVLIEAEFVAFLSYFGLLAGALLVFLWIFRRTRYWQLRSGLKVDWQFSIAQLLAVTTVVALLAVVLRYSTLFETEVFVVTAILGGSAALVMAAVIIWILPGHWLLRTASVLAVALGLTAPLYFGDDEYMFGFALYHFLTQAIVLVIWLAWGQILPIHEPPPLTDGERLE
jgi:hypothetical protein